MKKTLIIALFCYLTQSAVCYDLLTKEEVTFDKHTRIQVIAVKGNETIFYHHPSYYQIESDRLMCR